MPHHVVVELKLLTLLTLPAIFSGIGSTSDDALSISGEGETAMGLVLVPSVTSSSAVAGGGRGTQSGAPCGGRSLKKQQNNN